MKKILKYAFLFTIISLEVWSCEAVYIEKEDRWAAHQQKMLYSRKVISEQSVDFKRTNFSKPTYPILPRKKKLKNS